MLGELGQVHVIQADMPLQQGPHIRFSQALAGAACRQPCQQGTWRIPAASRLPGPTACIQGLVSYVFMAVAMLAAGPP